LAEDAGAGAAVEGGEEVLDGGGAELLQVEVHGGERGRQSAAKISQLS
jgi:hypothetical protein